MGHSRDRAPGARHLEALDRREPGPRRKRPEAPDRVLELQRSAGNQAVSALLARSPDRAKPKEDEKAAAPAGAHAVLPGIGTIPLLSVSFGGRNAPTTGRRGEDDEKKTAGEIVLSSKLGEHSPKLNKAALDGKPMEVEVVIPGGKSAIRLKLKGALVSSYATSGDGDTAVETWTLNFEALEQAVEAPEHSGEGE